MTGRRIEQAANFAIIASAVLFCAMAYRYFNPSIAAAPAEAPIYSPGDAIGVIPGLDLTAGKRAVLFFVSSTCKYCTDSMPFYRDVATKVNQSASLRNRVELIAVGREAHGPLKDYVASHGFAPDRFSTVTQTAAPKLALTPTLVLVDSEGRVDGAWIGQLDRANQDRFFRLLAGDGAS